MKNGVFVLIDELANTSLQDVDSRDHNRSLLPTTVRGIKII
ncbi:MAG TPA: hypothetical protein PL168_04645 [Methanobacterium sp.]|nr:hypothetical protein [Methanobacterium sp.]